MKMLQSRLKMFAREMQRWFLWTTVQLLYLESQDSEKDISLYTMTPCSISSVCDVSTICIGMAASMGAFLLSSGAKGKRISLPNSEIMIHQPLISGGLSGQCTDIKIQSDHLVRIRQRMNEILAANTGKSRLKRLNGIPNGITICMHRKHWNMV